jgi:hypothetical protein
LFACLSVCLFSFSSGLRDAAALVEFFNWLEKKSQETDPGLDECILSDKILEFRQYVMEID